jgi:hypothetical protein
MCSRLISGFLIALSCSASIFAHSQIQTTPRRVPNVTAPGPQRPAPPDRQQPLPGARAPQPVLQTPSTGAVEGFVYWDTGRFSHVPVSSCTGLAVTVSVGSSSGGPLTAYTPLGTLSNNFKYVGQVKEYLVGGKVRTYDVCTYGFDKVPVGPDLQVKLAVTQPWVFSPVAVPLTAILGPIKIVSGQCNMLPRLVNPTSSDLTAKWGSCQNMAYDVNFVMHTAPRPPLSGGAQMPSGPGSIPPANAPAPTGTPLLPQESPGGTPMLSGRPQPGMLASGTTSNLQSPSTATPGSKVELNPQPLPPRTAASGGIVTQRSTNGNLSPQPLNLRAGCSVTQLQLRFRTGSDDLRGGKNNLNVEVHLADGTMQVASNVNHGASWGNNSTNVVTVPLQHPVAPNQIKIVRLVHSAQGGYTPPSSGAIGPLATPAGPALAPIYVAQGMQSEDNWDMAEFQATAIGSNFPNGIPIASFGFHRFTGSVPDLSIAARPDVGCPDPNQVSKLSFVFQTGNDDLRGGNDNLNVAIRFADGKAQVEKNVNQSVRWADGSTHGVVISLNQPVPQDQIKAVTLETTFWGGWKGDNWNMNSVQITAVTEQGKSFPMATSGFHRFSADPTGPKARRLDIPVN